MFIFHRREHPTLLLFSLGLPNGPSFPAPSAVWPAFQFFFFFTKFSKLLSRPCIFFNAAGLVYSLQVGICSCLTAFFCSMLRSRQPYAFIACSALPNATSPRLSFSPAAAATGPARFLCMSQASGRLIGLPGGTSLHPVLSTRHC